MGNDVDALGVDEVLRTATERTGGLEDLGDGPFVEPLGRFVESLAAEARLNDIGRIISNERMLLHTVNRLHYVEDRKRDPEIATQKIEKPVFIIGMPRTGTTILHDILASDPQSRAPMTWEVMFPSPPPRTETFDTDPRIAQCAATMPDRDAQLPGFDAIHPMGPQLTQECVVLMGEAMCTPLFHNQFRVPGYQDWVDHEADWAPVYDFHHRQLQHFQAHHSADRWVLKTGAHLWGLDQLLATYPDARIVFTHRDPVKSMTSYSSLTTIVRRVGSDEVDPVEVADDWIARLQRVLLRGIDIRQAQEYPDAVFYDMYFPDFIANQFREVEKIYHALGLEMTDEGAAAMQWFIDDNPPGKHGIHRYSPEEFGVDPAAVRDQFRDYIDHFGLTEE
ncbi:MAG: sulfotransferase [Acidimicrobiales bacterium]